MKLLAPAFPSPSSDQYEELTSLFLGNGLQSHNLSEAPDSSGDYFHFVSISSLRNTARAKNITSRTSIKQMPEIISKLSWSYVMIPVSNKM